jgi:Tfp pilus assembly protein PilO
MRRLNPREKIFAIITVMLVLLFGIVELVIKPVKRIESRVDQELLDQNKILRKDINLVNDERQLSNQYEELLKPFIQQGSDEEAMSVLLAQLETLANEAKLRIVEIKPQKGKKADNYKFLSVGLSFQGTLLNIERFLYAVQSSPNDLNVDELILESNVPGQDSLTCRINLSQFLIPVQQ